MGGLSNGLASKEFFSLDLSQSFDATTPPWKDLTATSPLPVLVSWATASSNIRNDTIFLFGGIMRDTATGDFNLKCVVYTYDFKSNQWLVNPPAFQGIEPETRREFASVSDQLTGKLYIHGGTHDVGIPTVKEFNDFFILDGNNLSWSQIGKTGANMLPTRIDHVAVLIANGIIVFIGGRDTTPNGLVAVPMDKLTLYDTKADTWDLMTTIGGQDIDPRAGHTAVYAANGQIIVYGGATLVSEETPTPELVVLDTTTKPFKWIAPPTTTPEVAINSLTNHQANLIGDYMVVTFGNITNKSGPPLKTSNSIQILDIVNYKWVKSFPGLLPTSTTPAPSTTPVPSSPSPSPLSTTPNSIRGPTMALIVVSVSFVLIIAASISIFLLCYRNRQKRDVPLSSFNNASSQGQIINNDDFTRSISATTPSLTSQGQIINNDDFMRSISATPPSLTSQGPIINDDDDFMRSISATIPSLISSPDSQSPSNHNSAYSLLNSNDNNISPPSMLSIDPTDPAPQTSPMITTPPSTTPTTATNSIYGSDINNNNNNFGNFGIMPQIYSPPNLVQQQQLQLLQQLPQQFQSLQLLEQQLLQQLLLRNYASKLFSPTSNLQQFSNTMDPNLNNTAIDTNMSTTNQVIRNDNDGNDNGNGNDNDGNDNGNGNDNNNGNHEAQ